jgi:flagellum-specific ATP synthase
MERAGTSNVGTITGLYTVLVEGDDMNEPIADAARGILDGHHVLTRKLAQQGHYPALDVLQSISRLMDDIVSPEHLRAAAALKQALALYPEAEDLITVGAYQPESNPQLDRAIALRPALLEFLRQQKHEFTPLQATIENMQLIAASSLISLSTDIDTIIDLSM